MGRATLIERLKSLFVATDALGTRDVHGGVEGDLPADGLVGRADGIKQSVGAADSSESPSVMAGCVQLIGLDEIKAQLGPHWEKLAGQALSIVDEVLGDRLGAGDVFRPINESTYQICFESDDEAAAKRQAERISVAIYQRLVDELIDTNGVLSVTSFTARVPTERFRSAEDPTLALHASLLEIQREAATREVDSRQNITVLRCAGALFQPLWSNRDFGHTKNRCVLDAVAGAAAAKHLDAIEHLDDLLNELATVDSVLFTKSIEGLHQALSKVKQATIVIPVHFHTLASGATDFMELALTLPQMYRKFVLLDVIGVPSAGTAKELAMSLRTGRTITDRIVLQLSPTDHRFDQHIRDLVWGASLSIDEFDIDDPRIVPNLSRFALIAAEGGLYSFAYGANTIGKASAAATAGFDYIGGTAVHSIVPLPRPHGRFSPIFGERVRRTLPDEPTAAHRRHARFVPLNPSSILTHPDGKRQSCRILNFSASGAAVSAVTSVEVGSYIAVGSLAAQVVRSAQGSFAVRFLEVQQLSVVQAALATPPVGDKLLLNLRTLGTP